MNINWDEMPDWADVWIEDLGSPRCSGWHKEKIDSFMDADGLDYLKGQIGKNEVIYYPPETKPEWSGEDLPPVGTVCEVLIINIWRLTKIIGYDNGLPVFKVDWSDKYCYACGEDFKFRPIKSDKEKWVEQLCKTLSIVPNGSDWLDAIYDALISGELPIPKGIKNESK